MFDLLLAGVLVFVLPVAGFWRTWAQRRARNGPARMSRYLQTLTLAGVLSAAVIGEWLVTGRDGRALGLGLPITGWIGLGIAILALVGVGLGMRAAGRKSPSRQDAAALELLPVTAAETRVFVLFSLGVGFGWELLYRGYLLWVLTPRLGVVGAVLLAAFAYGYRGAKPFVGSLVSALVFTLAYVLTHSLWWLVIIHAGLPLLALRQMRASSSSPARGLGGERQAKAA